MSRVRLAALSLCCIAGLSGSGLTPARADILVSSQESFSVLRFDEKTGEFLGTFIPPGSGGLYLPSGLAYGSDGNLYVADLGSNTVARYDGQTGEFLEIVAFVPTPTDIAFGPDRRLYVASLGLNGVYAVDVVDLDPFFPTVFVTPGSGGLSLPEGLSFGPDGNLYVGSLFTDSVLLYDGLTGEFLDVFASGGGLSGPTDVTFGPDGDLYVAGFFGGAVYRFDGQTGESKPGPGESGAVFADGLDGPAGLAFGSGDRPARLYVTLTPDDSLAKINARSGAVLGHFVPPGRGGLASPFYVTVMPEP